MFKMYNVWTFPTYKTHNIGTELSYATLKLELDWIEFMKIEDVHENEDELNMKAYLKNEDNQQNEVNRKNADNLKNEDDPQNGDM